MDDVEPCNVRGVLFDAEEGDLLRADLGYIRLPTPGSPKNADGASLTLPVYMWNSTLAASGP